MTSKKNNNTFRFVNFQDRLKEIHVDVIRRRRTISQLPGGEYESFFHEALDKWSDLDGTQHFTDFKRDIPDKADLQSYAQILHHQKKISDSLRRHLVVESSACIPTLLKLTVAFCRDLQKDFYEQDHFWPFFDTIIGLFFTKSTGGASRDVATDTELMKEILSTLGDLLVLCCAPMSARFPEVYDRFRPLINHRRAHLRRFASEALSFLVRRKSTNLKEFMRDRFKNDQEDDDLSELLFQAMRLTNEDFHSRAGEMLAMLMDLLENTDDTVVEKAMELLTALHPKLAAHAIGESPKPLLVDVLLNRAVATGQRLSQQDASADLLEKYCRLLSIWCLHCKKGTFFDLCLPMIVRDFLIAVIDGSAVKEDNHGFYSSFLKLASSVFGHRGIADKYRREFEKFTKSVFDPRLDGSISLNMRSDFIVALAETSSDRCGVGFELTSLPAWNEFVERILAVSNDDEEVLDGILECYCRILIVKDADDAYDLFPGKSPDNLWRILAEKISSFDGGSGTQDSKKLASIVDLFGITHRKHPKDDGRRLLDRFMQSTLNRTNFDSLVLCAGIRAFVNSSTDNRRKENGLEAMRPVDWIKIFDRYGSGQKSTEGSGTAEEEKAERKRKRKRIEKQSTGAKRKNQEEETGI